MRNSLLVKFYPVEDLRDLNCLPNLQILDFLTLSEDPPAEICMHGQTMRVIQKGQYGSETFCTKNFIEI